IRVSVKPSQTPRPSGYVRNRNRKIAAGSMNRTATKPRLCASRPLQDGAAGATGRARTVSAMTASCLPLPAELLAKLAGGERQKSRVPIIPRRPLFGAFGGLLRAALAGGSLGHHVDHHVVRHHGRRGGAERARVAVRGQCLGGVLVGAVVGVRRPDGIVDQS